MVDFNWNYGQLCDCFMAHEGRMPLIVGDFLNVTWTQSTSSGFSSISVVRTLGKLKGVAEPALPAVVWDNHFYFRQQKGMLESTLYDASASPPAPPKIVPQNAVLRRCIGENIMSLLWMEPATLPPIIPTLALSGLFHEITATLSVNCTNLMNF